MVTQELISEIERFKKDNYYVRVLLKEEFNGNSTIDGEIRKFEKNENNLSQSYLTMGEVVHISDNFPENKSGDFSFMLYSIKSIKELKSSDWKINMK